MANKRVIPTIAAALASLSAVPSEPANALTPADQPSALLSQANSAAAAFRPNVVYPAGEDLLGLIVTKQADGTVVAQHASHVSHASHASHASHFSSR